MRSSAEDRTFPCRYRVCLIHHLTLISRLPPVFLGRIRNNKVQLVFYELCVLLIRTIFYFRAYYNLSTSGCQFTNLVKV